MGSFIDMTGWVMAEHGVPNSRLTVVKRAEDYIRTDGRHEAQWLCYCNCGSPTPVIVIGNRLRRGKTLSCGCIQKEVMFNKNKKHNTYDLSGEFGIGWTSNTNTEFYFDLEDYDLIKDYCWCESIAGDGLHTLKTQIPKTRKSITMHILLGFANYDHIDKNELNNRKENLRKCTHQENSRNRGVFKNNTSGVTGVSFNKTTGKWFAQIVDNNKKTKNLGSFLNKDDAIRARLRAEKEIYREFAPQQHLYEQYGID